MNVIAFSSIKGGVGKSSCAILTASCLAAAQARVLIIDTDLNNSTTFFFSTEGLAAEAQAKNIAAAQYAASIPIMPRRKPICGMHPAWFYPQISLNHVYFQAGFNWDPA